MNKDETIAKFEICWEDVAPAAEEMGYPLEGMDADQLTTIRHYISTALDSALDGWEEVIIRPAIAAALTK